MTARIGDQRSGPGARRAEPPRDARRRRYLPQPARVPKLGHGVMASSSGSWSGDEISRRESMSMTCQLRKARFKEDHEPTSYE